MTCGGSHLCDSTAHGAGPYYAYHHFLQHCIDKGKVNRNEWHPSGKRLSATTCLPCWSTIPNMSRCLHCKERLLEGGTPYSGDFCSEYCYSTYAGPGSVRQRTRGPKYHPMASRDAVGRILERNCNILKAYGAWRRQANTMDDIGGLHWMRERGFDFSYHTHVTNHADGSTEVWCYDAGYRLERNGNVAPLGAASTTTTL